MKIPVWICSLLLAAALTAQSWTLREVVNLKVAVAELRILVTRQAAFTPAASQISSLNPQPSKD